MKTKVKVKVLYCEVLQKGDILCRDRIMVKVARWKANGEELIVLTRQVMNKSDWTINDETILSNTNDPALQRIGIRVFDELKAAHPTLCDE